MPWLGIVEEDDSGQFRSHFYDSDVRIHWMPPAGHRGWYCTGCLELT